MKTTYAVVWREGDGPRRPGKLELLPRTLRLESGSSAAAQTLELPYDDLDGVDVVHGNGSGHAVALTRRSGPPLFVSAFAQPGIVSELAERITEALQTGQESALVLLPIRPELASEARSLVSAGPPFDPGAVGLDRHEVFVGDDEVAFLFYAPASARVLGRLLEDPGLWRAAAEWEHVLAAPPRVAEHAYSWSRERGFTSPIGTPAVGLGF